MLNVTSVGSNSQEMAQKLTTSEQALKFGVRLHLLSLLLEVSAIIVCCWERLPCLFCIADLTI